MPLSEEQKQAIDAMPPEGAAKLLALIREFKARYLASPDVPPIEKMINQVDDRLMQQIVADNRRGVSAPSGLIPEKPGPAPVRGSGWAKTKPLEPPSGVKLCDQIADHFAALDREQIIADAVDRTRKIKG